MRSFFRTLFLGAIALSLVLVPGATLAANCNGVYCTSTEVGPFMKSVKSECINVGNCSVDDIFIVFANVGNWILGVIGLIVLVSYVVGGIYLLTSAGNSERISSGKNIMKMATFGLVIVFIAYFAVTFLTCSFLSPEFISQGFFGPPWVKDICNAR